MARQAIVLMVLLAIANPPAPAQSPSAPALDSAAMVGVDAGLRWPVPSRVRVTERTVRMNREGVVHYTVLLERAADGRNLSLKCRDFTFEKLAGRIPSPGQDLLKAKVLSGTIPDLILDRDGNVVSREDLDEAVARTLAQLGVTGSEAILDEVRVIVGTPGIREALARRSTRSWERWALTWRGAADLESGTKRQSGVSMTLGETGLPASLTFSHEGAAPGRPGYVVLRADARADEEAAREVYARTLAGRTQGQSVRFDPAMLTAFLLTRRHEAVIEPGTLRPLTVRSEQVLELRINGGRPHRQTETHDYAFGW